MRSGPGQLSQQHPGLFMFAEDAQTEIDTTASLVYCCPRCRDCNHREPVTLETRYTFMKKDRTTNIDISRFIALQFQVATDCLRKKVLGAKFRWLSYNISRTGDTIWIKGYVVWKGMRCTSPELALHVELNGIPVDVDVTYTTSQWEVHVGLLGHRHLYSVANKRLGEQPSVDVGFTFTELPLPVR